MRLQERCPWLRHGFLLHRSWDPRGSTHRSAQTSHDHRRRGVGSRPEARTSRRGVLGPGPVAATGRTLASSGGGRHGGAERDRPARVYRVWLLDPPAEQARTGGRDVRGLWRADAGDARSRPHDVDGSPALRGATSTRAPGRIIDRVVEARPTCRPRRATDARRPTGAPRAPLPRRSRSTRTRRALPPTTRGAPGEPRARRPASP